MRENTNKLYRIRVKPWVTADITVHPEFLLKRFYYNEVTADIDKFQTNVFGELLYSDTRKVCVGLGWET